MDVLIFIVVATIKLYTAVYVEVGNLCIKFYVRAICSVSKVSKIL